MRQIMHLSPAMFGADGGVVGGAERYALELARHMAEIVPTRLVTFGTEADTRKIGKLDVRVIGGAWAVKGQSLNPFTPRIAGEILDSTDVLHCHQQHVLASSFAAAVCRAVGKRAFVSDLGGGGWDISAYVPTDRWFHGHLHISEYSRRIAGHIGWPRSHVIWGGVDTNKFRPGDTHGSSRTVLYVGRMLPHKGINYLVEALPPGLELRVVGRAYHKQFAADLLKLSQNKDVVFDEQCEDADLVRAYQNALCLVLPSVYKDMYGKETKVPELLGQTLLEGMACGIPVICTDVASMPELVVNGLNGFVVPPNDAAAIREKLLWLHEHPAKAKEMGNAGRQLVLERFTWRKVAQHCLELYHHKEPRGGHESMGCR